MVMFLKLHSCRLISAFHFIINFQVLCFLGCFIEFLLLQLRYSAPYISWVSLLCLHLLDICKCLAFCHTSLLLNNLQHNVMNISCHVSCIPKQKHRNRILPNGLVHHIQQLECTSLQHMVNYVADPMNFNGKINL